MVFPDAVGPTIAMRRTGSTRVILADVNDPLLHIVLVAPTIAPNTGNAIRMSANVGAHLHLVEPLGFSLEDRLLRRAGLDYHDLTVLRTHSDWPSCVAALDALGAKRRYAFSSHATTRYDTVRFQHGDVLVFGAEADGLPAEVLAEFDPEHRLLIPMRPGNRSLNLSNACAVVAFEVWRQHGFSGAAGS